MSVGQLGWSILLAGLPFAHFLSKNLVVSYGLDPWHAQTTWMQAGLLALWGGSGGRARALPANRPFPAWLAWTAGITLYAWTVRVSQQQYPLALALPMLHLAFLWLFYTLAVGTWTEAVRTTCWRALAWATVVVVAYGWVQVAHLDQFYLNIDQRVPEADVLVGTIGNPSHFGAHLALCWPFVLAQKGWGWRLLDAALVGLLALTRSSSGCAAAWLLLTLTLAWRHPAQRRRLWAGSGLLAAMVLGWLALTHPAWLSLQGREGAWPAIWKTWIVEGRSLTGWGLGELHTASAAITSGPLYKWRHAHCEPLQVWMETGAVGLGLVGWAVVDWGRHVRQLPKTPELGLFVALGAAFAVISLVSFPAHLWLLGSFGLIAYAGVYRLAQEQEEREVAGWP